MPLLLRLFIDSYWLEDPGQRGLWRFYGLSSLCIVSFFWFVSIPNSDLGCADNSYFDSGHLIKPSTFCRRADYRVRHSPLSCGCLSF